MRFFILMSIILLFGCGQKQWSTRGYKKGWIKSDTIRDTILTKSVSFDTLFSPGNDTTIIHKGKLTEKFYYNTKTNTVYLKGECASDTVIVEKVITNVSTTNKSKWEQLKENWSYILLLIIGVYIGLRLLEKKIDI